MLGVRYNFSKINNGKTNVNYNVNNYSNNGGGSSTMARKYGSKFNNAASRGVSSGGSFSINGKSNHYYIGNSNSNFTHDPFSNVSKQCDLVGKNTNVSVKNTKGLMQTRLANNGRSIRCNPVNSYNCYRKSNKELLEKHDKDIDDGIDPSKAGLNKHLRSENNDSSSKIERAKCFVDRSAYQEELLDDAANCKKCDATKTRNVTKDLTAIGSYVVGYDVYLTKKKNKCSYKPPDAKVIAC